MLLCTCLVFYFVFCLAVLAFGYAYKANSLFVKMHSAINMILVLILILRDDRKLWLIKHLHHAYL